MVNGIFGRQADQIIIAAYTVLTACGLVLAYAITVTKFRLWDSNPILEIIPKVINHPVAHALSVGVSLIAVVPYRNDLYIIWLVVLSIVFDNVHALTNVSLLEKGTNRLSREYVFLYNCFLIGSVIIVSDRQSHFFPPLIAIWSLLILKFIERLICYKFADQSYGIKNINFITNYMETEHKKNEKYDPITMMGYTYLVIGEENARYKTVPPSYTLELENPKDEKNIVKLDKVWKSKQGLLDVAIINKGHAIRDICLSFALFKLIRRRFFGFRMSESKKLKTKDFIFQGLLCKNADEVFRVIRKEMGFLRDFFYTRYPVAFALGFPIFNIIILIITCMLSVWISALALHRGEHHSEDMDYLRVNGTNVDYCITNGLLIVIIITEIMEVLSYIFSDWTKVILICRHVRKEIKSPQILFKILSLLFKLKFSESISKNIGQYSLLKSYNRGKWKRFINNLVYYATIGMVGNKMVRGVKADEPIVLTKEVKAAIIETLLDENAGTNIWAPLKGAAEEDVKWLDDNLKTHPILAIMAWHIATSLCEICPIKEEEPIDDRCCSNMCFPKCMPSCCCPGEITPDKPKFRLIASNLSKYCANVVDFCKECMPSCCRKGEITDLMKFRLIASNLSKYCAYLVVFAPELLPTTTTLAKLTFDQIVKETKKFFKGVHGSKAQYNKMTGNEEHGGCKMTGGFSFGTRKISSDLEAQPVNKKGAQDNKKKEVKGCKMTCGLSFGNHKISNNVEAQPVNEEISNDVGAQPVNEEGVQHDEKDEVIYIGAKFGRILMKHEDDTERWEMMATVWLRLILYLAPKGDANGHLKHLAVGGEFITHLWILFYHAGIVDGVSDEFSTGAGEPQGGKSPSNS